MQQPIAPTPASQIATRRPAPIVQNRTIPVTTVQMDTTVSEDFRSQVHHWVEYSQEIKTLQTKLSELRAARDEQERTIVAELRNRGMERAMLQVRQGAIKMGAHTQYGSLTYTLLEGLLPRYFASVGQPNKTKELLEYIKTHRPSTIEYGLELK